MEKPKKLFGYVIFIIYITRQSQDKRLELTPQDVLEGLERNFNGLPFEDSTTTRRLLDKIHLYFCVITMQIIQKEKSL